jgi:lipopolysaccharide biosynthesis protein
VLIAQKYLPDDDLNFIKEMIKYFQDPRYIKVDDAPLLIVYRPQHLPDSKKTIKVWRDYCKSVGIEKIHLCAALTHGNDDYKTYGFDSGVQFPPHDPRLGVINDKVNFFEQHKGYVIDYRNLVSSYLTREYSSSNVFLTVTPSWDNTARTGDRSFILANSSPNNYQYWLASAINKTLTDFPNQERMVFINAWNEWAEGCHLEPDRKYGHQFLEATLNAKTHLATSLEMEEVFKVSMPKPSSFFCDIKAVFASHLYAWYFRVRTFIGQHPLLYIPARKVWQLFRK